VILKSEVALKRYLQDYALLFIVAGLVVALDQWTKSLVMTAIPYGEFWSPWPWLAPYARFVHWNNTGAAFGLLQGFNIPFAILAVLVSIAIIYYFPRVSRADWWLRLALILQMGGALGNLVDRIVRGQVTDFISVGNFAVFNVADSSISVGVAILLVGMLIKDYQERKQKAGLTKEESNPDAGASPTGQGEPSASRPGEAPHE
jgi:signal peptidase II